MKNIILLLIVAVVGWQVYARYEHRSVARTVAQQPWSPPARGESATAPTAVNFRCDGRTHCSQMTSCAEATFFLKNCPGTKMDGNHDGVPCEQQWCH